MKRLTPTEEQIHRSVAQWLDLARTPEWFWFHPSNGGYRTKAEAGMFKALGVKPGVPDISIVFRGAAYFIELKREGGKLTDIQSACHDQLKAAGARIAVCRSLEDVQDTFREWRIPMRVR